MPSDDRNATHRVSSRSGLHSTTLATNPTAHMTADHGLSEVAFTVSTSWLASALKVLARRVGVASSLDWRYEVGNKIDRNCEVGQQQSKRFVGRQPTDQTQYVR